jgi:hypothetical protein
MSIKHRIVLPMSMEEEYKNAGVEPGEDLRGENRAAGI